MKTANCFFKHGAVAVIWLCVLASVLAAESLTYRETEGGLTTTHTIVITPQSPGYRIELQSRGAGGGVVLQTFRTAADLSTLAWTFQDAGRQMELSARRQGDAIVFSGNRRGEKIQERFNASGAPWNQLFQMGLAPFVLGDREETAFRSIATQGPGELKIGKMSVTREGPEEIEMGGRKIAAIHVRISLSGLLSVFWHGDYWYRRSDGRFLRYRGKNRSGGPIAVSELIEEKVDEP